MPSLAASAHFSNITPLCSSTRSPKLVPEIEYYYGAPDDREGIRRPLSPVRFRRVLKDETPPKIMTVKEKNEGRARGSPFVSHMTKSKKEHYLFVIGSVKEPDDPDLLKEMALTMQLSKIATPIKANQNSRNLHLPKKRLGPQEIAKHEGSIVSPIKVLPKITIPTHKNLPPSGPDSHSNSKGSSGHSLQKPRVNISSGVQEPGYNVDGDDMLWNNLNYCGGPLVPSSHAPSARTLAANACATPVSAISDLSDRDTMTPLYTDRDSMGTRQSGGGGTSGIYGDFEDDLISAGSVNDNEDEYIL